MTITAHDDAVGERAILAGTGIDITGATISALNIPADAFALPAAVAALKTRPWRYVVPNPAAAGGQHVVGIQTNTQAGANTPAVAYTDHRNSLSRINTVSNTLNVLVGQHFTDPGMGRGNLANVGGFYISHTFSILTLNADAVVSIGINNVVIAGGADPAGSANRMVLGASTGDANLSWISTDNVGGATKSAAVISKANILIGDPNTNGPCVYEVRMWALANAAAIHCELLNLTLGTTISSADISATLPIATFNLRPTCVMSSKTSATPATQAEYFKFFGVW